MGAILLIAGPSTKELRARRLAEMAELAPYRGHLEIQATERATIGVQQLNGDAFLYRTPHITLAFHGYAVPADLGTDAARFPETLATRLSQQGAPAVDNLQGEFTLLAHFHDRDEFFVLRSLAGKAAFFAHDGGDLLISAEPQQIRNTSHKPFPIDLETLFEQATNHRLVEEPDRTHYTGIRRFLATYRYHFNGSRLAPEIRGKYWELADFSPLRSADREELARSLHSTIRDAVDGSLGTRPSFLALSGGLDSNSIWAAAQELAAEGNVNAESLRTVSQVYPGTACDESEYIDRTDEMFGVKGIRIDMTGISASSQAEQLIKLLPDHPPQFSMPHVIPLIDKIHRLGAETLMLGLGGDEWFSLSSNWPRHYPIAAWQHVSKFKFASPRQKAQVVRQIVSGWARRHLPIPRRLNNLPTSPALITTKWGEAIHRQAQKLLNQKPAIDAVDSLTLLRWEGKAFEIIEQSCALFGIEFRAPPMNIRLVDFCHQLPPEFRYQPGKDKYLLRLAMQSHMPPEVVQRDGKTSFESSLINDVGLLRHLPSPEEWHSVRSGFFDKREIIKACNHSLVNGELPNWLLGIVWLEIYLSAHL